jgi:hypothetical protein
VRGVIEVMGKEGLCIDGGKCDSPQQKNFALTTFLILLPADGSAMCTVDTGYIYKVAMYKISRFKDAGFHFVACIENKA